MTRSQASRLAIGTAQFGSSYGIANQTGLPDAGQIRDILDTARAAGVETLDTAMLYGEGASEKALGTAGAGGFAIVSKLPPVPADCSDVTSWVREQTEASLARLQIEKLHGLLLHAPAQLLEPDKGSALLGALRELKEHGLTDKFGVSVYAPDELDRLLRAAEDIDLVQAPFNIVDRRMLTMGWLDRLADRNVEFHARSAFLQGLLVMPSADRPAAFERWSSLWSAWDTWLQLQQIDPVTACLKFLLSFAQIDRIIVGVEQVKQLEQILMAIAAGFSGEAPDSLASQDADLINPSRWSQL